MDRWERKLLIELKSQLEANRILCWQSLWNFSPCKVDIDNFLQADLMECCSASLLLQSRIFLQSKTTISMWVIHVLQHWAGLESCAAVREYSLQLHWADLDSPGCCSYITMLHSCVSSRHSALSNVILQIIHTAATAAWHPSHALIFPSIFGSMTAPHDSGATSPLL